MFYIKSIKKTCDACPAQWSGETVNHESVYVRFRWGTLRIEINDRVVFSEFLGEDQDDEEEEKMLRASGFSEDVVQKMVDSTKMMRQYNPGVPICYDGSMSFEKLKEVTKHEFNWPDQESP